MSDAHKLTASEWQSIYGQGCQTDTTEPPPVVTKEALERWSQAQRQRSVRLTLARMYADDGTGGK